jgi:hypothetical protein
VKHVATDKRQKKETRKPRQPFLSFAGKNNFLVTFLALSPIQTSEKERNCVMNEENFRNQYFSLSTKESKEISHYGDQRQNEI